MPFLFGQRVGRALLTIALPLYAWQSLAQQTANISLGSVSAPPGGVVALPILLNADTADVATLILNFEFDPNQITFAGIDAAGTAQAGDKLLQHRSQSGKLGLGVYGGVTPLDNGQVAMTYWKLSSQLTAGASVTVSNAESSAASPDAEAVELQFSGGQVNLIELSGQHSADISKDWALDLAELLRVIQLYNFDSYHCDATSDDGYKPGAGNTATCTHHNSDYKLPDWSINLSELLRAVQFYNSPGGAYHPDLAENDGFKPGPFTG